MRGTSKYDVRRWLRITGDQIMCQYTLTDIRRMEKDLDFAPLDIKFIGVQDYGQWLAQSHHVHSEGSDHFLNLYTT